MSLWITYYFKNQDLFYCALYNRVPVIFSVILLLLPWPKLCSKSHIPLQSLKAHKAKLCIISSQMNCFHFCISQCLVSRRHMALEIIPFRTQTLSFSLNLSLWVANKSPSMTVLMVPVEQVDGAQQVLKGSFHITQTSALTAWQAGIILRSVSRCQHLVIKEKNPCMSLYFCHSCSGKKEYQFLQAAV